MIFSLIGLFRCLYVPRRYARLPFSRCILSHDDYDPVTVSLTEKEVKRCIEAIDWYIESFAPKMEERGLDLEIARYEDLMYRFMGVPDKNMKMHVEQREEDQRS